MISTYSKKIITYSKTKEANDANLGAPPSPNELRGQHKRGGPNGSTSKATEKLEGRIDGDVGRKSDEKGSDGHDEAGEEQHVLAAERRISQRGQQEAAKQTASEEHRSGKARDGGVGALQAPVRHHGGLCGPVPGPRAFWEVADCVGVGSLACIAGLLGAAPRRRGVGEDADEGLLGVKDPREGDEDRLEELGPVELAYAEFDCGPQRGMLLVSWRWWWLWFLCVRR